MSGAGRVVSADGAELIDLGQGKLWLGFVLRSMKRHKKRAILVLSMLTLLGGLLGLSSPKQWAASTQMVAKADDSAFAAVDPSKGGNREPALLAESTIKAQSNLEKIVDDLGLVNNVVVEGRLVKAKRSLLEKVFGAPDPAKKREDLINQLRGALNDHFSDQERVKQAVLVDLLWRDPIEAKNILDKVNENYIADRRTEDLGTAELGRDTLKNKLKDLDAYVAQLRQDLGIFEDDDRPIPQSSPLNGALTQQQSLADLLKTANLRVTVAEQNSNLTTKVVSPAQIPRAPISGSLKTIVAGILAGAMLAAFVTAATDLSGGKVVEPWQVARGLNLPLLAELPK